MTLANAVDKLSIEEKRIAEDGSAYTRAEFIEYFKGTKEWDAARVAAAPVSTPQCAQAHKVVARLCIGNLSKSKAGTAPGGFTDVRVDRQTALGNPFPMGDDGHDERFRDAVCEACNDLFLDPLNADLDTIAKRHGVRVDSRFRKKGAADPQAEAAQALSDLERRLRAGESLRLMCWCHPKRCHGDGIARLLHRRIGEELVEVLTAPTPRTATPRASTPRAVAPQKPAEAAGQRGTAAADADADAAPAAASDASAPSDSGSHGRARGGRGRHGGRVGRANRLQNSFAKN